MRVDLQRWKLRLIESWWIRHLDDKDRLTFKSAKHIALNWTTLQFDPVYNSLEENLVQSSGVIRQRFALALFSIIIWAIVGPKFDYSDTWQLVINTGTTIVTFLMVFVIQNTQNRDTQAIHLRLDELIRVTKGAHNLMLEDMADEHLERLREIYERLGNLIPYHTRTSRRFFLCGKPRGYTLLLLRAGGSPAFSSFLIHILTS
jgi:low affinity Fe/Cu permease